MPEIQLTIKSCVITPSNVEETINNIETKKTFNKWLKPVTEQMKTISEIWSDPKCDDFNSKLFYMEVVET